MGSNTIPENPLSIIAVAGCSSGAGKTAVAETITSVLSRLSSTAAVKITVTHGDGGCPHGGKGCNVCSMLGGDFQIVVKDSIITQPGTDTGRLSAAGASPVIWLITRFETLGLAWSATLKHLSEVEFVVVESNSLAELLNPTITFMIVDATVSRKIWKPSAERLIASADYVVFNNRGPKEKRVALLREVEELRGGLKRVIQVTHPNELGSNADITQNLKSLCFPIGVG